MNARSRRRTRSREQVETPIVEAPIDGPLVVEHPAVVLGQSPGAVEPGDAVATAGRKAMWVHLDRLLARAAALDDPDRPDDLRKYRVATRRLRAALRTFARAYPPDAVRPLRRGLSDLADAVGAVRDLDHRLADLDRWAVERGGESAAGVAPLVAAWSAEREQHHRALRARVATRKHRRLLTELVAFVESPATQADLTEGEPRLIRDRIASQVWSGYEDVRAFAGVVDGADVSTLHRVRLAVKRLRDGLEFLADLVGPQRTYLTERLVALQDHLGALNDASVAAAGVRAFLETHHAGLAPAQQAEIAAYLADREGEIFRLQRSVGLVWRPVVGIDFARRLGRLVVLPV